MKKCTKCNEFKELSEFYKCKSKKGGYHCHCKVCKRIMYGNYKRKYTDKERARHIKYNRETRLTSTEFVWSGINKRPYTGFCEICNKRQEKYLAYHHWDDNNPHLGMWLCIGCHRSAETIEHKFDENKYLELKEIITIAHGSACGELVVKKKRNAAVSAYR